MSGRVAVGHITACAPAEPRGCVRDNQRQLSERPAADFTRHVDFVSSTVTVVGTDPVHGELALENLASTPNQSGNGSRID